MLKMFYEEDQLERQKDKVHNAEDEDEKPLGALDLYDDPAMEEFFSRGVRGGQSFIATTRSGRKTTIQKQKEIICFT